MATRTPTRRTTWAVGLVVIVAAAAAGVGIASALRAPQATDVASAPFAVQTTFAGLPAPTGDPVLPGFATATPRAGSVTLIDGPFNDRFTVDRATLSRGTVSGELTITSDVSDVIELVVTAGFYDASGALLGTAQYVHHGEEHAETGTPSESESFSIPAPEAFAAQVASAAIGVPVLVNE